MISIFMHTAEAHTQRIHTDTRMYNHLLLISNNVQQITYIPSTNCAIRQLYRSFNFISTVWVQYYHDCIFTKRSVDTVRWPNELKTRCYHCVITHFIRSCKLCGCMMNMIVSVAVNAYMRHTPAMSEQVYTFGS